MALTADSIVKLPRSKKDHAPDRRIACFYWSLLLSFLCSEKRNLDALEAKYNTLAKQLQESKAIHRDLEKFEAEVNKLNAELAVVRTQLPDEGDPGNFEKYLQSWKESHLEFILFRPSLRGT